MGVNNAVSKAEFSRLKKVNRSTISRWVTAGRLVVDDEGLILVKESEERLTTTADPTKAGVVARHSEERGDAVPDLFDKPPKGRRQENSHYGDRIRQSARHEAAKAERAELELAQIKKELVAVAGVRKAMSDFATMTREEYSRLAFDLKFKLAAESDPNVVFSTLKDALEDTARKISATMKAQIEADATTQQ